MKKNLSFYKVAFIFIFGMILFQSCSTEKSGPHATAVIQFAEVKQVSDSAFSLNGSFSDSDFVLLLNSSSILLAALERSGQPVDEKNLKKVKEKTRCETTEWSRPN
ncbi:MAG: hypothetical protein IAF38_15750 [Bacteroidia bacterium]|nr:hypothetical protein [Bacteroidia bacterium]